jgi:hypothetical protein
VPRALLITPKPLACYATSTHSFFRPTPKAFPVAAPPCAASQLVVVRVEQHPLSAPCRSKKVAPFPSSRAAGQRRGRAGINFSGAGWRRLAPARRPGPGNDPNLVRQRRPLRCLVRHCTAGPRCTCCCRFAADTGTRGTAGKSSVPHAKYGKAITATRAYSPPSEPPTRITCQCSSRAPCSRRRR